MTWLATAIANLKRSNIFDVDPNLILEMTPKEIVTNVESSWKGARGAFNKTRTPHTLAVLDAKVQAFVTSVQKGSVTPASLASSLREGSATYAALVAGADTFRSIAERIAKPKT